jgi:cell division protein FtsB
MEKLIKTSKNPYIIATGLFLFWILIFDNNSYIRRKKFSKTFFDMKKKDMFYKSETERLENEIFLLQNDLDYVEKVAREKYNFRKWGEDVYYLEKDNTK